MSEESRILRLASSLITRDKMRDEMYDEIEKMVNCEWEITVPEDQRMYMHEVISTDPRDAIETAASVFSTEIPNITVEPYGPGDANTEAAQSMEEVFRYIIRNVSRMKSEDIVQTVTRHAYKSSMVAVHVEDMEQTGNKPKSIHGRKNSRMNYKFYNPRVVYPFISDTGLEKVLIRKRQEINSIISEYHNRNRTSISKLKELAKSQTEAYYMVVYELWEVNSEGKTIRSIWVAGNESDTGSSPSKSQVPRGDVVSGEIQAEYWLDKSKDTGLEFFPWSVREYTEDGVHNPLLRSVYQSGQWHTQNAVDTVLATNAIINGFQPHLQVEQDGYSDDEPPEIDTNDPSVSIVMGKPGQNIAPIPQRSLDPSLLTVSRDMQGRIDKSTVARVIQLGEFAANTPGRAIDTISDSVLKKLQPYRRLAEMVLEDMLYITLMWLQRLGEDAVYPPEPFVLDEKQMQIKPSEYPIDYLDISVELSPYKPGGDAAKAQAAATFRTQMNVSSVDAFKLAGFNDPQEMYERSIKELLESSLIENQVALQRFQMVEAPIQQAQMQMQQMQQAQQMQMQMQAQAVQQQQAMMEQQQAMMMQQQQAPQGMAEQMGAAQPGLGQGPVPLPGTNNMTGAGANPAVGGIVQ